jgi:hypothetical protein
MKITSVKGLVLMVQYLRRNKEERAMKQKP